jgi:hypothetical protein
LEVPVRARGFNLLETVVASAVLITVMFMLFSLYPSSALALRRSQDHLQADQLALSLIAEQQALPFKTLTTPTEALADVVMEGTTYHRQVEIFSLSGRDPDVIKGVRVTVSWRWVRGPQSVVHEIYLVKADS